ncbi:MAG TPA: hypothetical protein VFJ57_01560 [Solirubrobacterales bacterium]|nr:hypothetical protein [Solirubrobacterales bacterium]
MALAQGIRLSQQADEDLRTINGKIEPMLFGELDLIPEMAEDDCPALPWQVSESTRRKADLGAYTAIFFVEEAPTGAVAVIEFVREASGIKQWWGELEAYAAREEARVQAEERAEGR